MYLIKRMAYRSPILCTEHGYLFQIPKYGAHLSWVIGISNANVIPKICHLFSMQMMSPKSRRPSVWFIIKQCSPCLQQPSFLTSSVNFKLILGIKRPCFLQSLFSPTTPPFWSSRVKRIPAFCIYCWSMTNTLGSLYKQGHPWNSWRGEHESAALCLIWILKL